MFRYFTNDWIVPVVPILQVRKSSLYSRKQATVISGIDPIEDQTVAQIRSPHFIVADSVK